MPTYVLLHDPTNPKSELTEQDMSPESAAHRNRAMISQDMPDLWILKSDGVLKGSVYDQHHYKTEGCYPSKTCK